MMSTVPHLPSPFTKLTRPFFLPTHFGISTISTELTPLSLPNATRLVQSSLLTFLLAQEVALGGVVELLAVARTRDALVAGGQHKQSWDLLGRWLSVIIDLFHPLYQFHW